jgi:glycosyltransferase involved in cell wall biosynthesis
MANPLAAVNALATRGHQVTVLSADSDAFDLVSGSDWSLTDRISQSVTVVRVDQPRAMLDTVINRWSEARRRNAGDYPQWMCELVHDIFPEPVANPWAWYPAWLPNARATARALHQARPFDLVIATILPAASAGVALALNAATGVPFVIYERDSWVFSPFTGEPYPDSGRSRPMLEMAFERAHQVWYINTPLADLHRREFAAWADRIREVRNGWDPESLPRPVEPRARAGQAGLVVRYVGTSSRQFPWEFVTSAWQLARAQSPLLRESVLEFVGPAPADRMPGDFDHVTLAGPRPREELWDVYSGTDILLFVKEGGGMATSGKIYEYAATGLPIVSSMVADHDARHVLAGRPLWFDAAGHTPEALAAALVAAAERAPGVEETPAAREHAERFRRDQVFSSAFAQLEESLGW